MSETQPNAALHGIFGDVEVCSHRFVTFIFFSSYSFNCHEQVLLCWPNRSDFLRSNREDLEWPFRVIFYLGNFGENILKAACSRYSTFKFVNFASLLPLTYWSNGTASLKQSPNVVLHHARILHLAKVFRHRKKRIE